MKKEKKLKLNDEKTIGYLTLTIILYWRGWGSL